MKRWKRRILAWGWISGCIAFSLLLHGCGSHSLPPSSYLGEWRTEGGNFERRGSANSRISPPLEEAWRVKVGKGIIGSPVPAGPLLVVPTTDGKIKAYLIEDGEKIWETKIKGGFIASPVVSDKRIFISSEYPDGTLYCLDIRDGETIWSKMIGPSRSTSTIDGGVIYTLTNDDEVFAHNTTNGNLLWKIESRTIIPQSPITSGDSLYIMSGGDTLKVLSTINGEVLANVSLPRHYNPPLVKDGHRLICGSREGVGIISTSLMEETAHFTAPRTYKLALSGDTIVGMDGVRSAYALDTRSGMILWTHSTSGLLEAAPVIIDTMSLIVTIAGEVRLLDTVSGEVLWEKVLDTSLSSTPTASGEHLILATEEGYLIAYTSRKVDPEQQ